MYFTELRKCSSTLSNYHYFAKQLVNKIGGGTKIREDKIKLAKARIISGYYHNKEVLSQIADKLIKEFNL